MKVKKLEASALHDVLSIYQSCVTLHQQLGFNQWDETYPNSQTALLDIEKGWLYGLFNEKDTLVAVISITEDEPKEYQDLPWEDTSGRYFIIHRLCVLTPCLRKGYAKLLMDFAEQLARTTNVSSIRLDTFSLNKDALAFYRKLNYKETGKVCFPKRTDSDYTCFEKIV